MPSPGASDSSNASARSESSSTPASPSSRGADPAPSTKSFATSADAPRHPESPDDDPPTRQVTVPTGSSRGTRPTPPPARGRCRIRHRCRRARRRRQPARLAARRARHPHHRCLRPARHGHPRPVRRRLRRELGGPHRSRRHALAARSSARPRRVPPRHRPRRNDSTARRPAARCHTPLAPPRRHRRCHHPRCLAARRHLRRHDSAPNAVLAAGLLVVAVGGYMLSAGSHTGDR